MLPYAFDPHADCPRWRLFIDEVQPGALVRHVVKGFAYDEVTPDRVREMEDDDAAYQAERAAELRMGC